MNFANRMLSSLLKAIWNHKGKIALALAAAALTVGAVVGIAALTAVFFPAGIAAATTFIGGLSLGGFAIGAAVTGYAGVAFSALGVTSLVAQAAIVGGVVGAAASLITAPAAVALKSIFGRLSSLFTGNKGSTDFTVNQEGSDPGSEASDDDLLDSRNPLSGLGQRSGASTTPPARPPIQTVGLRLVEEEEEEENPEPTRGHSNS